ncbi:MAG: sulfatase-like hydrolase/transferase [Pseudomonadota bacterium]
MDDRRRRDGDDDARLELERIRQALGPADREPDEAAPRTDPGTEEQRELPELPREVPEDRFLRTFGDGSRGAPVEEIPLQGSAGLAREQRLSGVEFEDDIDGILVGALADLPPPRSPVGGAPHPTPPVGGASTPRYRPVDGPPTRRAGADATLVISSLAGILVFVALFLRSVLSYQGVEYMGVDSGDIAGTIFQMFRDTIILAQVTVLGIHLLLGVAAGLCAGLLLLVTRRLLNLPGGRLVTFGIALVLVGLAHVLVLGHTMALQPQLFTDTWYARGGVSRLVQVFFSDWWPIWATPGLGLLAVLYLGIGGAVLVLRRGGPGRILAGLPLLGAGLVLGAALWSPQPGVPPDRQDRLNILILSADSLREDALDHGTERGFARLVDEGFVFEDGWTSMPRTLPAWVSFLTGLRPFRHGIRNMFPSHAEMARVERTVVHRFREAGYQTAVFSDFAGDIFTRMDFGFETVDAPSFSLDSNVRLLNWKLHLHMVAWLRTFGVQDWIPNVRAWERMPLADAVTDDLLGWLAARDAGRPFLATLFWSSTHFPFSTPYPFYRLHATSGYDGPNRYMKTDMESTVSDVERQRVRALYAASVDAVDQEVARVLDVLEDADLLDNTVVILMADHGENLYEHDFGVTHGDHLYGQASHRIPFVVRLPGGAGGSGGRTARGIDLTPTLLALAGLEAPEGLDGVALFDGPARPGGDIPAVVPAAVPAAVYSETGLVFTHYDTDRLRDAYIVFENSLRLLDVTPHGWTIFFQPGYLRAFLLAKHRMWLRWPHKLLYVPTRQGPRWELFDLEKDPGETENLFDEGDPLSRQLRDELVRTLEAAGDVHLEHGYLTPN